MKLFKIILKRNLPKVKPFSAKNCHKSVTQKQKNMTQKLFSFLMVTGSVLLFFQGQGLAQSSNQPQNISTLNQNIPPLGSSEHFLPEIIESRLILRLQERRVYYYEGEELISSYPVAIGREGWETPTGSFQILQKVEHPSWEHPFTGDVIPPGPENPLGVRWLGFWTDGQNFIGFHGTPNEELIGQAVSHGCVRMRNQDIIALFDKVEMGTPVIVE